MKKYLLLFFIFSACVSPEQRAAQQAKKDTELENKKEQYCENMGAPLGSEKYYDCRKWIEQELAIERGQLNQVVILSAIQQQKQQQVPQQNFYMPVPHLLPNTTNCLTTPSGNSLMTTCH